MRFDGLPKRAHIREVCPRDGFQSVKDFIPTEKKLEFIEAMIAAGVREMEVTSFVSPKAIPQLADSAEVLSAVKARHGGAVRLVTLVPNVKGAERALAGGADCLNYVFSASESHNRANLNRSVEESLAGLADVIALAKGKAELSVSIATSFMCPFEGRTAPARVTDLMDRALDMGANGICLAETIGTCNPLHFAETLAAVRSRFGDYPIYLHIHDTFGMALLNVKAALDLGYSRFDAAIGGLGGCPFAPGAAGNAATEDLVFFLNGIGVETGMDAASLVKVARQMQSWGLKTLGHLVVSSFGREKEGCCGA